MVKPWLVWCGDGVFCARAGDCGRCNGIDDFQQNDRCTTYSFRPNGFWPRDHPERMERVGDGDDWYYANGVSS